MHVVDRRTYERWQKGVIASYWPDRERADMRSHLYESDKVIVAIFRPEEHRAKTRSKGSFQLRMFHIGSGHVESVDHGRVGDEYWFAATDTGGLTNARTPASRDGIRGQIGAVQRPPFSASRLYSEWRRHSGRDRFYGNVFPKFQEWLRTIQGGYCLAFVRQREGERLIVPASDVERRTGLYYLRDYSSDGPYATAATPEQVATLYCSVQESEIIPNFNRNNILNEHTLAHPVLAQTRSSRKKRASRSFPAIPDAKPPR